MPTLSSAERIGSLIAGRYKIRRLLGEGGFSSVYEAVHTVTDRPVAVKLLHPHLIATAQVRERFLLEARAMARISHDGIVQVLDAGADDDGTAFMVLELLSGEPLDATLNRVRLTWDETVNVGLDVLAALSEAHKHKVIHRDIKPGNIFIVHRPDGSSHAKLLDFGIAHIARSDGKPITQQGMILGTPEYMSPEQGRAGSVGPESDIWSVGIVLFECLTGFTPFVAESTAEVLLKVATTSAPSLRALSAEVPAPIADVIDRSLQHDRQMRYRTAEKMRTALLEARATIDVERASAQSWEPPEPSGRVSSSAIGEGKTPDTDVSVKVSSRLSRPDSIRPPKEPVIARPHSGPEAEGRRFFQTEPKSPSDPWASEGSGGSGKRQPAANNPEPSPTSGRTDAPKTPNNPEATPAQRVQPQGRPDPLEQQPTRDRVAPTPLEGFRAARTTFNAPPSIRRNLPAIAAGSVLLVGAVSWLAFRSILGPPAERRDTQTTDSGAEPAVDSGIEPATARQPDAPAAPAVIESSLVQRYALGPPSGGTAADQLADFARHSAVSQVNGTTQRVFSTCVPAADGPSVYLYQLAEGRLLASSRSQVACSGFDLGVIPDASGDGTDDVAAVGPGGDEIVLLNSQTMMAWRRLPSPRARGLATGLVISGEPLAVLYVEQAGLTAPTSLLALALTSGQVRWRALGSGPLGRIGQPLELGLSVGPDASGDGVQDVAVGVGPVVGAAPEALPERPRCVQLFSGADGVALWREPFCQLRGSGAQSVSLGPDIDGDGRGDVAIGTARPAGQDPPVVIVSGRDAHIIRSIAAAPGEGAEGFGWPVALGGDMHGGRTPNLVVGSIGPVTYVTVINSVTAAIIARERLGGVGAGSLRLMPFASSGGEEAPWNILVGDPGSGLRAFGLPTAGL